MTTATAPTAPGTPSDPAGAPGSAAPVAERGSLARMLTPVEPARPVQHLGTTASMGQDAVDAAAPAKSSKDAARKGSTDSAVGSLVRAFADRLRRTGTTTKRTHTVQETRVGGYTGTSTKASTQTGQHRTARDAKLADLRNKTSQQQGKTSSDVKRAATSDPKTPHARAGRDGKSGGDTRAAKGSDAKGAGPASAKGGPAAKASGGPGRPSAPAPAKPADAKGLDAKTVPATKAAGTTPDAPAKAAGKTGTATGDAAPNLRTRPARDAGYRDGTRAAAVTGQARAWRDGTKDGWDDRTAADKAEGKTMDDARARNATHPKPATAPKMAPASGSTVDLAKKPAAAVPVQVTAVGQKAVDFTGDDGAPHTMTRGEVRTLKQFERRLGDRKVTLGKIEEGSKVTRELAVDLAGRAQRLAEDAKAVKGGGRVVARLVRLAEQAQQLRLKAEEIEKSAHRGHEAVTVLATNAKTRHGGIYQAVVDSPLTAPAERDFYKDKAGG